MKNFITFLIIAAVIIIIIVLIKKPDGEMMNDQNNGAAGIMLEGSDSSDYNDDMIGGDAEAGVGAEAPGATTAQ